MIIEKIRSGTRPMHEKLEDEMKPFIDGATTTESYVKLLHLFYGYYEPLERGVRAYIDEGLLPDIKERRNVNWIINDLKALGYEGAIPTFGQAPAISDRADAMGALYVMEGSSLGGKVICRMLQANLGYNDLSALSFFNGYGGSTGSRWKEFLAVLDKFSDGPDEDRIVRKANEVFEKFGQWLRTNLP
jgi:heme oxygenase (biliverdin-IX-beta and delta-forming)